MAERKPLNSSGIFYDSADLKGLKKWFDARILGGATTNPLILQKEGIYNIPGHIAKMVAITGKKFPISIEIPDSDMTQNEMLNLAKKYAKRFPGNAIIKIPMDPIFPEKAFEVVYKLGQIGIRVNATLGHSMGQLVGAAEALRGSRAEGDNYISLFWARREEARDMMVKKLVKSGVKRKIALEKVPDAALCLSMTLKYLETHNLNTRVIIGSIRSIDQIEKAFLTGADIVTIPPKLINEWMFTQRGVETVKEFNQAYRSIKNKVTLI
jgi:transaldolase